MKKRKREAMKQENGNPKARKEEAAPPPAPMENDEKIEGVLVEIKNVDYSLNKAKLKVKACSIDSNFLGGCYK